jgi:hemoglobin
MKAVKRIVVVVCVSLIFSAVATAQEKSLYERLGGQAAIEAVVKDFAGRVLADTRINKKFAKSDANRLVKNLTDFVCAATGGPCAYNGKSMKDAHTNMGVTEGEFNALVEDLVATLDSFKVSAKEKNELLAALGPLGGDIIEKKGNKNTGTDLPANFMPAPPLTKSLYERLGGQAAIEAVVKDFAGRVLADTRINKKFAKSDANRLVKNLTDFVCAATGGPCTYNGQSMKAAHTNMGVTEGEFNALVEDLVATLDSFKVPAAEKNELLAALGPLGGDIIEKKGNKKTGTNLPAKFKPAPPLKP